MNISAYILFIAFGTNYGWWEIRMRMWLFRLFCTTRLVLVPMTFMWTLDYLEGEIMHDVAPPSHATLGAMR
ncbi:unnamed protein product [Prunus armeniaca]|uniref:Uncharacterized protein n=1 Tax=Prunus armeniaca TaxID=36596 RepID=A0A6J5X972_PRUAR|nr:unnamed protein product [Prunus armeniaca]